MCIPLASDAPALDQPAAATIHEDDAGQVGALAGIGHGGPEWARPPGPGDGRVLDQPALAAGPTAAAPPAMDGASPARSRPARFSTPPLG